MILLSSMEDNVNVKEVAITNIFQQDKLKEIDK